MVQSNTAGRITFANRGPNTRGTQFFINTGRNANLDRLGFAPFGEVEGDGLEVVASLYSAYGECFPNGPGPRQDYIDAKGNAYLRESFPKLDYIKEVVLLND